MDGAIGVFRHSAAHPTGIVCQDPAHHAGIDRGRIRPDAAAKALQDVIEKAADNAGLRPDPARLILNCILPPMFRDIDQDAICYSLPGETCPGGPERHGDLCLLSELEESLDL